LKIAERLALGDTLNRDNLVFLKQLGVSHVIVSVGGPRTGGAGNDWSDRLQGGDYWKPADLLALSRMMEDEGLKLGGLAHIPYSRWDKIIRGSPGRDEQIENWGRCLEAMAKADVRVLQYNWVIHAGGAGHHMRTSRQTPSRGGALVSSFDSSLVKDEISGHTVPIAEETMWENLTYFLKAIIPVAEALGVRMGMHPADPQMPSLFGAARIIRSRESYNRLMDIVPSPSNAITFCLGCFAQMLEPDDVYQAIEHFGTQKKIAFVHFRNVRGNAEKFEEAYWDDGKMNMLRAMQGFYRTGFTGCLIPDHTPHGIGDTKWGHRSRAFAIGYMTGLKQAVASA